MCVEVMWCSSVMATFMGCRDVVFLATGENASKNGKYSLCLEWVNIFGVGYKQ